jgi:hypothetical protein
LGNVQRIASADINGDGKADAVIGGAAGGVGVYLNDGAGKLILSQSILLKTEVTVNVALADLNGDGHPDLVVTNGSDSSAFVYLNDGAGKFGSSTTYNVTSGYSATWIVAADVNGDGRMDLLFGGYSSSAYVFSVWAGKGDGTFSNIGSTPVNFLSFLTGTYYYAAAMADINGDGILDLVLSGPSQAYSTSNISVASYLGDGKGHFTYKQGIQPPLPFTGYYLPTSIALADLNRDGNVDLIVSYSTDPIGVAYGNGDGTFGSLSTIFNGLSVGDYVGDTTSWPYGNSVATSDVDGDGYKDVLVANCEEGYVYVLHNNTGSGTFTLAQSVPGSSGRVGIAIADLNGDGIPDLLTSQFNLGTLTSFLGSGKGTFSTPTTFHYLSPLSTISPTRFTALDLNGDGVPDLLTGDLTVGLLSAHISQSNGAYLTTTNIISKNGPQLPAEPIEVLGTGDFNRDGRSDAIILYNSTPTNPTFGAIYSYVGIALNNGDGTLTAPAAWFHVTNMFGISSFKVADLNGDGNLDLLISGNGPGYTSNGFQFPGSVLINVYLGNGIGNLAQSSSISNIQISSWQMDLADIDGDGSLDLILNGNGVSVSHNSGGGTFGSPQTVLNGAYGASGIATADFNDDGHSDIAVLTGSGAQMLILLNDGKGGFPANKIVTSTLPSAAASIIANDVNLDGKADLIFGSGEGFTVSLGNGDSTFNAKQYLYSTGVNRALYLADVNGDGYTDILVAGVGGNAYDQNHILLNQTSNVSILLNLTGSKGLLASSASSLNTTQPLTLTATLAPSVAAGLIPTGSITVLDGTGSIGMLLAWHSIILST